MSLMTDIKDEDEDEADWHYGVNVEELAHRHRSRLSQGKVMDVEVRSRFS
jgi:hypothetical protein